MSTAQSIDSDPTRHLVLLFAGLYLVEGPSRGRLRTPREHDT